MEKHSVNIIAHGNGKQIRIMEMIKLFQNKIVLWLKKRPTKLSTIELTI